MPIKVTFDAQKMAQDAYEKLVEWIEPRAIKAFRLACMDAVNYAKRDERHGGPPRYTDQTGALNSSTGFGLYHLGELVDEYFVGEGGIGTGHTSGVSAGKATAAQAASRDKLVSAVIVAGMHYAVYVEAKGKDVLSGAELQFPDMLDRRLREAFEGKNISYTITAE